MNSYFQFWNVAEPVFASRSNFYVEIPPFEQIKKRLLMQLQIGMKLQILTGKTGSGKTRVIQAVANTLEVSDWDCLYCMLSSQTFEPNSLTKRIMRFLDTSIDNTHQTNPKDLITRLEKIGKSKRKILIILDILDSLEINAGLTGELNTLVDLCIRHNLPMHFIASQSNADQSLLVNHGTGYKKLISKATSICQLPELTTEEFTKYVAQYLSASHLPENLIPANIVEKILQYAEFDLKKSAMLLEALLIDCHLENDRKISNKNLNRILKQSALSENTTQIQSPSNESQTKANDPEKRRSEANKSETNGSEVSTINENGDIRIKTEETKDNLSSIHTKNLVAQVSDTELKTSTDRDTSQSPNQRHPNENYTIKTANVQRTNGPIGNESLEKGEHTDVDGHADLADNRDKKLPPENIISQNQEHQPEQSGKDMIPHQSHNEPNQSKKSMDKSLANLANLVSKTQDDHGRDAQSADSVQEKLAAPKTSIQYDKEKHDSGRDPAQTKRSHQQKRSKQNERKIRQKTEWNVPRISLAQLTKKA